MANTNENPNEETIKCVVVGDNNVGKTRLICARAYHEKCPHSRCFTGASHVPTVWAIDQYRINKQVLENARSMIDGTAVSIRLWDTFGDHHKNRKFAYGKADVVLICFSICDEKSLRQVARFWCPEVRKHCKNIPVILVGCKADLRFADLGQLNKKKKGCLSRTIRQSDILFPDKCRAVAAELNCPYYETSVVLGYGVEEVFENACRAALIYRKTLYFWNTRLKKITRPALQEPLQPPMPDPPVKSEKIRPTALPKLVELYEHELLTDVVFFCQDRKIRAHKVILAAASNVLFRLFENENRVRSRLPSNADDCDNDVFCQCALTQTAPDPDIMALKELDLNLMDAQSEKGIGEVKNRTCAHRRSPDCAVAYLGKDNHGSSMYSLFYQYEVGRALLDFCYSGSVANYDNRPKLTTESTGNLLDAARCFGIIHLEKAILASMNDEKGRTSALSREFLDERSRNMRRLFVEEQHFADVEFQVDDGCVFGHKVLLSAGSDMMYAMLTGRFIESENKEILLPYTTASCLQSVFEFVYLGIIQDFDDQCEDDVCELIALANQFCLQTLISYLENRVIESFERREATYKRTAEVSIIKDLCGEAVVLQRIAQIHNAPDLARWCLHFLTVHYNEACRHACKMMKNLSVDVQRHLEEHRWPPVWFIKQQDHYERALMDRVGSEQKKLKRY